MRYLLLSSVVWGLLSCQHAYKSMQLAPATENCLLSLRPAFPNELYRAQIDVQKRHFSGLLLVKSMPDSTKRVVFTTETGISFFDFSFSPNGSFKVMQIMEKLNKKVLINALKNDFKMFLLMGTEKPAAITAIHKGSLYQGYPEGKKTFWYVTDSSCQKLKRGELGAARKILAEANWSMGAQNIPDAAQIIHHNFTFNIRLSKIAR